MRSYTQIQFSTNGIAHGPQAVKLYHQAVALIDGIPNGITKHLRCHELARAVGKVLGIPYQDGRFEAIEHTWLWALSSWKHEIPSDNHTISPPPILDVYVPGALPQVQLVDYAYWGLPFKRIYTPGPARDDINVELVDLLVDEMSHNHLLQVKNES